MLDFTSKATLILPEDQLKAMFDATVKGATQHAGDGASAARLLTRINLQMFPFLVLGIPGKSYIIANLRETAGIPPGQLIGLMNQGKQAPEAPVVGPTSPLNIK